MVSNIFGKALIRKTILMRVSWEFYLLHMFGGLRWMKMTGTVKADQFDSTTSDNYICQTYLFPFLKNRYLCWIAAMLDQVCFS